MACSNCRSPDHNVQRCPTVRRCGHCNRPSHDRRNCPTLHPARLDAPTKRPPPSASTNGSAQASWPQIERLRELCRRELDLVAHLYWPDRLDHFAHSRDAHVRGAPWRLKATPGHGVRRPETPTINFLVADLEWVKHYAAAAERRDLRHGLLVRRAALELLAHRPGYDIAPVETRHPGAHEDRRNDWRYDIGNHRFAALDAMRHCKVVRIATPTEDSARYVDIPADAVVTWW